MLNVKQFDRIFLTGDKHGDFFDLVKDSDRYGFSDKDLLIILGDVGVNSFRSSLVRFSAYMVTTNFVLRVKR